jgi:hypothetical protein
MKTLAQFKADFAKLQAAVAAGSQQQKKHEVIADRSRELFNQGAAHLGQRIHQLKTGGHDGAALKDFLFDPEVQEIKKAIDGIFAQMEKDYEQALAQATGGLRRVVHDYDQFLAEMGTEIDRLVKAKDAAAAGLNGYLNDCKKYRTQQADFFSFVKDGPGKVSMKSYLSILEAEVQRTKVSKEAMLNRQKLQPRNLIHPYNHVKHLRDEILKQGVKYKAVLAKGDSNGAKTCLNVSEQFRSKIDEVVKEYEKAHNEFKEQLANDRKDGPTITKMIQQMSAWKKEADNQRRMSAHF